MTYTDRFITTDNLISHLIPYIDTVPDAKIKSDYAGFLSVSAVTVYELAIKDIFFDFAQKKNVVFGNFIEKHFSRINGKINIADLKGQHIKPFGDKYLKKFEDKLKVKENFVFKNDRKHVRTDYGNLIQCRHSFVHGGAINLTFNDVISSYKIGKEVIHSLSDAMNR